MKPLDAPPLSDADRTLAAEYVLGTLDPDERRAARQRIAADPRIASLVRQWERRLAPLHELAVPVAPPARLWRLIQDDLAAARQAAQAEARARRTATAVEEARPVARPEEKAPAPAPAAGGMLGRMGRLLARPFGKPAGTPPGRGEGRRRPASAGRTALPRVPEPTLSGTIDAAVAAGLLAPQPRPPAPAAPPSRAPAPPPLLAAPPASAPPLPPPRPRPPPEPMKPPPAFIFLEPEPPPEETDAEAGVPPAAPAGEAPAAPAGAGEGPPPEAPAPAAPSAGPATSSEEPGTITPAADAAGTETLREPVHAAVSAASAASAGASGPAEEPGAIAQAESFAGLVPAPAQVETEVEVSAAPVEPGATPADVASSSGRAPAAAEVPTVPAADGADSSEVGQAPTEGAAAPSLPRQGPAESAASPVSSAPADVVPVVPGLAAGAVADAEPPALPHLPEAPVEKDVGYGAQVSPGEVVHGGVQAESAAPQEAEAASSSGAADAASAALRAADVAEAREGEAAPGADAAAESDQAGQDAAPPAPPLLPEVPAEDGADHGAQAPSGEAHGGAPAEPAGSDMPERRQGPAESAASPVSSAPADVAPVVPELVAGAGVPDAATQAPSGETVHGGAQAEPAGSDTPERRQEPAGSIAWPVSSPPAAPAVAPEAGAASPAGAAGVVSAGLRTADAPERAEAREGETAAGADAAVEGEHFDQAGQDGAGEAQPLPSWAEAVASGAVSALPEQDGEGLSEAGRAGAGLAAAPAAARGLAPARARSGWRAAALLLLGLCLGLGGLLAYREWYAPRGGQWIAVLQAEPQATVTVRIDPASGMLHARAFTPLVNAGEVYRLWLVPRGQRAMLLGAFVAHYADRVPALARLGIGALGASEVLVTRESDTRPDPAGAGPAAADVVYRGRFYPE